MSDPKAATTGADPYRGVVLVLLVGSAVGTVVAGAGGVALGNPLLLDAAIALFLWTGLAIGTATAQRQRPTARVEAPPAERSELGPTPPGVWERRQLAQLKRQITIVGSIALLGMLIVGGGPVPSLRAAAAIAALSGIGAWLAATSARYLASVEPGCLPEARGLAWGARVVAWILLAASAGVLLRLAGSSEGARVLQYLLWIVCAGACIDLVTMRIPETAAGPGFPTNLRLFSMLGRRANPFGSLLDAAQRQLGIDLRSTWALNVVRHGAIPLTVAIGGVGWLSTALTVVRVGEQGLLEHLGVPAARPPLDPGLHLHWPWPVDNVCRVPVARVQTLHVGHEGEEEGGPENVLWAREHAKNEYTLLLGNGRDLIAVDAMVQFRIVDPYGWRYHNRDPAGQLRAIAYRAVMRSTVNRTLAETLSENVGKLAKDMQGMVQAEADALGLGVTVVAFNVGGLHPPVAVAADYQAVVSAEIERTTAAIDARAYRNVVVPDAEAQAAAAANAARASGAEAMGLAAGQAWSFRTLESEYQAAPLEYRFRRRLEAIEDALGTRAYTVVDERIERDGGKLWLTR
jgi:regulator of protease activity HflC (stomatin/prohibitin superfamily)